MSERNPETRPHSEAQEGRFDRMLALPGIGADGVRALGEAKILVIGAGGLGSPVLQYLAGAGVGTIGIVDFDVVDISNLHRQVIHRSADVGTPKTQSAARGIAELNPNVRVARHETRLDADNALEIMRDYDLVVDASDNFATRYLASDAAALLRLPYVWGSVLRFDGQVSVFWEGAPEGSRLDYRDLHPVPPDPTLVLSCSEAGVLGSLCGTIGSMMATEAIKMITGVGLPLLGRVQNHDSLTGEWRSFELRRSPDRVPVSELVDYEAFCGTVVTDAVEIELSALTDALAAGASLIDVREPHEHELGHLEGDRLVPLATLLEHPLLAGPGPVVVYCATGARSGRAASALRDAGIVASSLAGGYGAWRMSAVSG